MDIKLTQYSHGAGCGCKISPSVLTNILNGKIRQLPTTELLVGYDTRDDAAVMAIDNERAIISTTDFFMPIVDNPFDFGAIASVNALSDVYAMGGTPLMAISILGWPIDKLPPEVAAEVIDGARTVCNSANIPLAGGHSIDAPEPIFGLAATGIIEQKFIKKNGGASVGAQLLLTKPLGIGILTTSQKKGILLDEDFRTAKDSMIRLNSVGIELATLSGVQAMTDVTGFGLLGHLTEMCHASGCSAQIDFAKVPRFACLDYYLPHKPFPGGTNRNFASYGTGISPMSDIQKGILCDPQTSGGLLIAVTPEALQSVKDILHRNNIEAEPFGELVNLSEYTIHVK